jgi:hypothetical protein
MSRVEDLMYEAIAEGIREEVLTEVSRLRSTDSKLSKSEIGDVYEIALTNIRKLKKDTNELL